MVHSANYEKFQRIFVNLAKEAYDGKEQLISNLPIIIDATTSKELRSRLKHYLADSESHKEKLGHGFQEIGHTLTKRPSIAMQGLLKEALEQNKRQPPSIVQDAAMIAAIQKIVHYNIATFGSLKAFARHLHLTEIKELIELILEDEKHTDSTLTGIAEGSWISSGINAQAIG